MSMFEPFVFKLEDDENEFHNNKQNWQQSNDEENTETTFHPPNSDYIMSSQPDSAATTMSLLSPSPPTFFSPFFQTPSPQPSLLSSPNIQSVSQFASQSHQIPVQYQIHQQQLQQQQQQQHQYQYLSQNVHQLDHMQPVIPNTIVKQQTGIRKSKARSTRFRPYLNTQTWKRWKRFEKKQRRRSIQVATVPHTIVKQEPIEEEKHNSSIDSLIEPLPTAPSELDSFLNSPTKTPPRQVQKQKSPTVQSSLSEMVSSAVAAANQAGQAKKPQISVEREGKPNNIDWNVF